MRPIALMLVVAGCSLDVDRTGTYFQCDPDGTCKDGYTCVDNYCLPKDPPPPGCS